MAYHAKLVLDVYPDVMEDTSFQTGYFSTAGVFVPTSNLGRTLRLMARDSDPNSLEVICDSDADASICEVMPGDSTYVHIKIPSSITTLFPLGQHPFSVLDVTDVASDGEILIALGVLNVTRQAVY